MPGTFEGLHFGVRLKVLSIISTLILMTVCNSTGQTPYAAESGIEGVITISPTRPGPIRADSPGSGPLVDATFTVQNENGEATIFTTDSQGHFRALLAPGHYKIYLKGRKSGVGHFGPFEADVSSGKMTKVQWECDSGIR